MKYLTPTIIAALILSLVTGCSRSGNGVRVISAVYGTYTNYADVSAQVTDLLRLRSGFAVHPNYLHADPMRGYNKALVIIYDANGQRHIFTAAEGERVSDQILLEAARQ